MKLLRNRDEAGRLLAQKLGTYRDSGAVVVGISPGGTCVAAAISSDLGLPLDIIPCRRIPHPVDPENSIGSVATDVALVHECPRSIPQDYIYHQVGVLRSSVRFERHFCCAGRKPVSLRQRTVIVVGDILPSADSIEACLRQIREQHPLRIVVAVPVISTQTASQIRPLVDEIVFVKSVRVLQGAAEYYDEFPEVDIDAVKALLDSAAVQSEEAFRIL